MIPKGLLQHAQIPRDINKWKMPTSKFGHFWQDPQKMKSGWELNRKFFVRALLALKNDSQSRHAEIRRDINKWKFATWKFGHFSPKTMD